MTPENIVKTFLVSFSVLAWLTITRSVMNYYLNIHTNGGISNGNVIIRGYHMGGSVIWFLSNEWWCDITNERGTSEWVISHQHEFDKIISQCHPCDYLFIIYHNTRTNRNFVHTYHAHIYYTSTYCHFLTLQIAVCLSCETQQAIHNVLCDVLWQKKIINKKKIWKKKINKIISKKIISKK